jgi:hypothetical protein
LLVLPVGALTLFAHSSARADEPQTPPAQTAKDSTDDDAIKELRRLGAKIEREKFADGDPDAIDVTLGSEWKGKPSDFQVLAHLPTLKRLTIHGVAVTDDDLKQLDGSKRLDSVTLYGTKVTADGAVRLAKMHPGIYIDRRGSALLGIAGHTESGHVRIVLVLDGSPAHQAGLTTDDIIVKFQDQEMKDFESLTREIGNREPGDKITLILRRGDETLKKEIELGKWK